MSRNLLPAQCTEPGCPGKTLGGPRCQAHTVSRWAPTPSGSYGSNWRRVRGAYIAEHRTCEWPGCTSPAVEVDHIIRVRVDPSRRLDPTNLRALCLHHHRSRSARDAALTRRGDR
jgi:5-methylcytosine-specific restriction enzyme A